MHAIQKLQFHMARYYAAVIIKYDSAHGESPFLSMTQKLNRESIDAKKK